jgi:hypothetical protein
MTWLNDPPKRLLVHGPWYHGGSSSAQFYFGENTRWERDRSTSSLNEQGPGIYFTSKFDEAMSYGPIVVAMTLKKTANIIKPTTKPSLKVLSDMLGNASEEDRELFLSNFDYRGDGRVDVRKALTGYVTRPDSLLDAVLMLGNDIFRDDSAGYVRAVRDAGLDGAVVPRSYGVTHLVLWNPKVVDEAAQVYEPVLARKRTPARKPTTTHTTAKRSTSGSVTVKVKLHKAYNAIPGGLAAGKRPSDFPKAALAEGIRVEMEHTTSKHIATEIAMDHLTEDLNYYKKLRKIERHR